VTVTAPIALTMGDPAGIGGEIAASAWRARDGLPAFFVIDDADRLSKLAPDVPVREIEAPGDAMATFADALPVLPLPLPCPVAPGVPDPRTAPAIVASIDRAVAFALSGEAAGVVTNPISKKLLRDGANFRHPGHTEYLAHLTGASRAVMMLAAPELRVVPVTVHVPLADVAGALTEAGIVETARIVDGALRRCVGLDRPRLALAGLNPHAGEKGAIGREDIDVIVPAVARLRSEGIDASGPHPADTMFHPAARARYDVALCMYHDQALIPIKTLNFASGVNVTLGLQFVRTSPDHGTAYDIAGQGKADPTSLMEAIRLAASMAAAG